MNAADALVRQIEDRGGQIELHARGVRVDPPALLTPDLVARLRAVGRELVDLLRKRERSSPPTPPTVACELRRFPKWNPVQVVRFCCEPAHAHADGIPTFCSDELDLVVAWANALGVHHLPILLRNALFDLKAMFGGRIDPLTIGKAGAAGGRP